MPKNKYDIFSDQNDTNTDQNNENDTENKEEITKPTEGKKPSKTYELKAQQLVSDYSNEPFDERDSAAGDILRLKASLIEIIKTGVPEVKQVAQNLLLMTDRIIDDAKKTGKTATTLSKVVLTQQVRNLAKQVQTLESELGGFKSKYVKIYQDNLSNFDHAWKNRFVVPSFVKNVIADPLKKIIDRSKIKSWDDYLFAYTGENVEKGKEKECLAHAMAAVIMKEDNKPFSLEEADKIANNILQSKAFKDTFGKDGKLAEGYLRNRNITKAIMLMKERVDKKDIKKLQKEHAEKFEKFKKFIGLHSALELGFEIICQKDAENGTDNAYKMVDEYCDSLSDNDVTRQMIQAKMMTKLLKEADPVIKAAQKNGAEAAITEYKKVNNTAEGETPQEKETAQLVLKPSTEG